MRLPGAVRDHLRHNVVGYIALFCFVLGGTAIALPGKNKVNSADIKPNAVHASDIAKKAVTAAKIAPRSVDGVRVIDKSLTSADIDESTLDIKPAPSSIGPTELADRQRRLVFTPGTLIPGSPEPNLKSVSPYSALTFPDTADSSASFSTDVPGSRVEGTKMTMRVLWTAAGNGGVIWNLSYGAVRLGGEPRGRADDGNGSEIQRHLRRGERAPPSKFRPAPSKTAKCSGWRSNAKPATRRTPFRSTPACT